MGGRRFRGKEDELTPDKRMYAVASYSVELEFQLRPAKGGQDGAGDLWWLYFLSADGTGYGWRRSWEQVKSLTEYLDKAIAAKKKVAYDGLFHRLQIG